MRLRGMAFAAVVALAACSGGGGGGGGPKKGTVVVTGATNQQGPIGATKTFAPKAGAIGVAAVANTDPTKLELTVFKTELFDGTAWTTIFESATGTAVDLVSNAGGAFGQGTVPAGTYGKVRFTVGTSATFSAAALDTCSAATDATFLIDGAQGAPAQTQLTFATASHGGSGSWTANGSADYPFLISAPIDVRDAATTRVVLQFDTMGTVSCAQDGLTIPRAPQMHASSVVIPTVQNFSGGVYWIAHHNMTGDSSGPAIDLSTAQLRADNRRKAGYHLGWGLKAKFSAPMEDGTVGILTLSGGIAENRRRVDETDCGAECGYVAPTPGDVYVLYTIDADRRVSFTIPGGPRIVGGFSDDLGTFVGASIEDVGSADLVFGIKASGAQEVTGRYAWSFQNTSLRYPAGSTVASSVYTGSAFGWAKLDGTSNLDLAQYMAEFEFTNPALTYGNGQFFWNAKTKPIAGAIMPASVVLDGTGVGSLAVEGASPQWTVATPDGRVMLTLGDTTASDTDPGADTKYDQNLGVMLKQAAAGTQSLATIAGRWTMIARYNSLMDWAGDAVAFGGVQYGTITVAQNGAATLEAVIVDSFGNVASGSGVGKVRVQRACIGRAGGAGEGGDSLAWNDATCAADGGEVLDVAVISASDDLGANRDVVWFVVDETASAAVMVSTEGYDPATAGHGLGTTGYLVRSSR